MDDDREENESPMVHQPRPTLTQNQFRGINGEEIPTGQNPAAEMDSMA
jgi:hypothetical protein